MASLDFFWIKELTSAITNIIIIWWLKRGQKQSLADLPRLHFYSAKYDARVFRRYNRHFNAAKRILDDKKTQPGGKPVSRHLYHPDIYISCFDKINTTTYNKFPQLNIAITEVNVNPENLQLSTPVIIVHDLSSHGKQLLQDEILKVERMFVADVILWMVFILPRDIEFDIDTSDRRFSCALSNDPSVCNHITSALELNILRVLTSPDISSIRSIEAEVKALTNRVKKCSAIQTFDKPTPKKIPESVQSVLERYSEQIYRYGFLNDRIEVFVDETFKADITTAVEEAKPEGFLWNIDVIEGNGIDSIECFSADHLQGNKLYRDRNIKLENGEYLLTEDKYGTLGCTALANDSILIAITCNHVCVEGSDVYTYFKQRIVKLGNCKYGAKGGEELNIKTDLSFVSISEKPEDLSSAARKPFVNCDGEECEAVVMNPNAMDLDELKDEILHKKGATSEWTRGVVVGKQYIRQTLGQTFDEMVFVKGIGNKKFAERGDSGSIIFRESVDAMKNEIEIIGILVGGEYQQPQGTKKNKESSAERLPETSCSNSAEQTANPGTESSEPMILCVIFHEALEKLKQKHDDIQSITFFKPQ